MIGLGPTFFRRSLGLVPEAHAPLEIRLEILAALGSISMTSAVP